jgi:anoctamin-7
VTFYFAWLGFYTCWLLPAAIVGILVVIGGCFYSATDEYTNEICSTNITLCPLCSVRCSAQNLSAQCVNSRISRIFDYPGSMAYSIFMTFWAVTFLEFWKRRTSTLSCEWDVLDYAAVEEPVRPEIQNYRTTHGDVSEELKRQKKIALVGLSIVVICCMCLLVLASVVCVILYRLWIRRVLVEDLNLYTFGPFFAPMSAAVMCCIIMFIFNSMYRKIATKLTDLEMHEYQSGYERSLALKIFCFSFVNFFWSTLYVAFWQGKFMGVPGKFERWFGSIPPEPCTGQDCVFDLTKHIFTFQAMKLIVDNFLEHILP